MRRRRGTFLAVLLGCAAGCVATPAAAQESLASDLWRVAAGTVTSPAPFAGGVSALLWTPVVTMPPDVRLSGGVMSIQAPEEVGVSGGVLSVSVRAGGSVLSAAWGRLGIDDITRTETSPEGLGTVVVDAQVIAVGVSRRLQPWLDGGIAFRVTADQLGDLGHTQGGIDAGVVAAASPRVRFGVAARAVDPLGGGGTDASMQLGAEARSAVVPLLGSEALLRVQYGAAIQDGESASHLLMAGIALAEALSFDIGAVRESRGGHDVWRSRIGVTAATPHYRLEFGRDGGVNGFGATYALGLSALLR